MIKEEFKAKAKEIVDNEQFGKLGKLFEYDDINEIYVAQVNDRDDVVAMEPLMNFIDELYEQIKGDLK